MKISGWLVRATDVDPRRRIAEPAPEFPVAPPTFTPAMRPASMFDRLLGTSGSSDTLTDPIELPTSRLRAEPPVPVTTTSSSEIALCVRPKSAVTEPPAVTVTDFSIGW